MEKIINNPGLQHLAENIFLNLNYEDLKSCELINQSTKLILENPMFWMKKFIQRKLPSENQKQWIVQDLACGLVDQLTLFQICRVQIQKYVFSQMLQSRVVNNFFHS